MKKIFFIAPVFLLVILFFFFNAFFFIPYTDAQTAQSNCVITAIGNAPNNPQLPAGCGGESAVVQNVIALAKAHLTTGTYIGGTPSRDWAADKSTGPNSPPNFDCSGFVGWAWYWGSGGKVSMLGQTNDDWARSTSLYTKVVTSSEAGIQPGDLIYFNNGLAEAQPGHVGLFIGPDKCGANDCFLQYYTTGLPGNELSLKSALSGGWGSMMGYIHINVP
jgi:hypothetical protein